MNGSHASRSAIAISILSLLAASAMPVWGQANFTENFEAVGPVNPGDEGPANLIADGWIFRNQSEPPVGAAWYDGDGFGGQPQQGSGYLTSESTATDFFGGALSTWAILPDLAGLQAGDTFSIWVFRGDSPSSDTFFEVRRAPNGQTDSGSTATDVGDFTELLFSAELPVAGQGYQEVVVQVPGPGRIAMRYRSPFISTFAGRGSIFSVDALSVGPPPPPLCGVPLPQPGETVTWTAAGGPYTICENLLVPLGGSVVIEPGTRVTFEPANTLRVEGTLTAHGTSALPITFDGNRGSSAGLDVAGDVDISEASISVHINTDGDAAALQVRDSVLMNGAAVEGVSALMVFERCQFDGGNIGGFFGSSASVRLADCNFINGGFADVAGLVFVDHVTIDGQPLTIDRETIAQPTLIDNVSVTNYAAGAGLRVRGANYLIGSNVVTQGNRYPLEFLLDGGGLLSGSTLPATGNTNNYIPAGEFTFGSDRQWADAGIPYVIDGFPQNGGGSMTVAPGAVIQAMSGAGAFIRTGGQLNLQGTRAAPIRFEPFVPGERWSGLKWIDVFNARVRDTMLDGCDIAVQSDGGRLLMENCAIQNSLTGSTSVTGGSITLRNSRVLNNGIGMTTTTTGRINARSSVSPNVFSGNAVAVDYNNTSSRALFDFNWWNDPTGPTTSENPGGSGDVVEGLLSAWFSPWLTSAPPQNDDPPRVSMTPIFFTARAGNKIILRWKASDDSSITSQRIEFSEHGLTFSTLASLSAAARTFEFTVPIVPPSNLLGSAAIRVVAVDDIGQETWDEQRLTIPFQEDWTPTPQTVAISPTAPAPGQHMDLCWSPDGRADAWVLIEGDDLFKASGSGIAGCLPIGVDAPWVSTDTARAMVRITFGAGGRAAFWFSDFFEIRPDTRFGDAPPAVTLDAPTGGEQFVGGRTVPLRWTASDDEGLRAFHIQASYDAGRTWHFVEKDIPGVARSFAWNLPPSTGIADVRVRVIAVDHRFQSSSSTGGAFAILPGDGGTPGDLDGDGDVDLADLAVMLSAFGSCQGDAAFVPEADINADGCVGLDDLATLLANFGS